MTSTFDTSQISAFRFVRCTLDAQTGVVSLVYAFDQGPEFVEKIMVPGAPFALEGSAPGHAPGIAPAAPDCWCELLQSNRSVHSDDG